MRQKKANIAILVFLAGCSQTTDFMINNPTVNKVKISTPEFLESQGQIAQFSLGISNNSNIDLCFTGYDELGLMLYPQNVSLTKIGTPTFELNERVGQGADEEDTTTHFHKVLFVPSGETVSIFAKVNAHEYPIEMVLNDPENTFFFDLHNQYRTAGSVAVYDCDLIPSDGFFPTIPLFDDPEDWNNGFRGIVNLPNSKPFMFK